MASSASRRPRSRASRSGVSRPCTASAERSQQFGPFLLATLRELEERSIGVRLGARDERLERVLARRRRAPPRPESAGRCAWHRGRSARRAPGAVWGSTPRTGTWTRRSAACRILRRPPARRACLTSRCRRSSAGCSSGTTLLPSSALTMGAPSSSASSTISSRAPSAPWPARIAMRLPRLRISSARAMLSSSGTR